MQTLNTDLVLITPGRTISEGDIHSFAGIIGDFTPVHVDEVFACSTPFGSRIAHGTLVIGIATGLLTQAGILGERVVGMLDLNWELKKAVKMGDTIRAHVRIKEVRPTSKPGRSVVTFQFDVKNQREETVHLGQMKVLMRIDAAGTDATSASD